MPDDASGNFSLVSGYLAVTGQTVQPSNHNPPLEDIAAAMTNRLSRSGVAPMTGPLKTVTGSASIPAIYPNSNPAIGIYWTSTGVGFAGTVSGVRFIGELIPYTLLTAPALTVFPYGQTLLRASYPDLWALAQADIAAGNTFYNNGNGATTFGIGDMRGRVPAGKDDMGGSPASRLTIRTMSPNGTTLGAVNGGSDTGETVTLTTTQMPSHSHSGTTGTENKTHTHNFNRALMGTHFMQGGGTAYGMYEGDTTSTTDVENQNHNHNFTTSSAGGGAEHGNVQPTMICNYLLYAGA